MKTIKFIALAFVMIATIASVSAQKGKGFAGTITYEITYDTPGLDASMKAQMPSEMTLYLKGNKMAQETKSAMFSQCVIVDSDSKTSIMLMDIPAMNKQVAMKISKEDMDKQLNEQPKVKVDLIDETKKIAGYNCKKAEVTSGDNTITIYYTTEIGGDNMNWATQFKDIKGLLMEYSITENSQGMDITMKFTAKEVKEGKVKDSKFSIPSGYQELTKEEAKKMFGGE